ncbi:MAG: DUF2284 domain-containing protein [Oscillospiraceae bacterium]|nr:DUF2284 domain-containing protein [Oscillospiraceae bacterium]
MSEIQKYRQLALERGAEHAVLATPEELVFDGRTLLKCMFGCSSWGKGPTCPSRAGFLKPWEFEPLLRKYKYVLIVHSPDKKTAQAASFAVERAAFLDGDVLALSMSDCALCAECAGKSGGDCRNVRQARPSFHSVGINVFATAQRLGLPLFVLKDESEVDRQNWYAAVWLNGAEET